MASTSESSFKPPPVVECVSQSHCLSFGMKVYVANKICAHCLKSHDLQQLRAWANDNVEALALIEEELGRKHTAKRNLEAHGRYLCAFEDPDFEHCRWRQSDLNLRDARRTCLVVRRKGLACGRCWENHLKKIAVVQYFTPWGLCHEEGDRVVAKTKEGDGAAKEGEDEYGDLEGYDESLS
ncbi:hypothetical protein BDV95DRAFT_612038 [Massariosphaeria phaeospora]|uniref:Uncharacterized protein n=1 Tax=Massariosphaeria phaeospora TaxID=100035 RepID=A0A7C8I296_9PLEO|nr:hypothetical protein BDV95DRAFT_612038 [Massariosphaeria phaeospora]